MLKHFVTLRFDTIAWHIIRVKVGNMQPSRSKKVTNNESDVSPTKKITNSC